MQRLQQAVAGAKIVRIVQYLQPGPAQMVVQSPCDFVLHWREPVEISHHIGAAR